MLGVSAKLLCKCKRISYIKNRKIFKALLKYLKCLATVGFLKKASNFEPLNKIMRFDLCSHLYKLLSLANKDYTSSL